MEKYNLAAKYTLQSNPSQLDDKLIDSLWKLFEKIAEHWPAEESITRMKSNFLVFLSNRIEINPTYLNDYINAKDVINELIGQLGESAAYEYLLTDTSINVSPPASLIARARQLVSNEFVALYLSLGGFRLFGGELNYPGYFGGANSEEKIPYRTYNKDL